MNSEVVDDPELEIVEKDVIVNQSDANCVETIANELQHSDLGNLTTGPYRPVLNVS